MGDVVSEPQRQNEMNPRQRSERTLTDDGRVGLVRPVHDPLGMPLQCQLEHVHTVSCQSNSPIRVFTDFTAINGDGCLVL